MQKDLDWPDLLNNKVHTRSLIFCCNLLVGPRDDHDDGDADKDDVAFFKTLSCVVIIHELV